MEILTLLKANLKKKKSTFISVAILMIIVSSAMTAILSTIDNYGIGMDNAFELLDNVDAAVVIRTDDLTNELKEKTENSALVKRADYVKILAVDGIECGEHSDGNSCFLQKMRSGIKLYSSDFRSFEPEIPQLEENEIYLPLGYREKIYCNVGDTVTFSTYDGKKDFVIKGFVQEPMFGAQTVGWKQSFINDETFDDFYETWKELGENYDFTMIFLYRADDCDLSSGKFLRQLNLETKIVDTAQGALTREQTERFSTLLPEILTKLFLVFVIFLFVIVLILISHSISTEIESDYVSFGILKAQGFTKEKLMTLFFVQYLAAELAGIIIGICLSIPLEKVLTDACQLVTAVMPNRGLSAGRSLMFIAIIIAVSSAVIFLKTLPLGKISPVKAIGGGKEDIYFDSRIKLPIGKKLLSASLAARQFTSAKRRYIGAVLISAILVFFMLTVNLVINLITSKNALIAMGADFSDIYVNCRYQSAHLYLDDIKDTVTSAAEVKDIIYSGKLYISLNGENLMGQIVRAPEKLTPILKGRAPIYDNELVITEMVANALEIDMGDEVTLRYGENEGEYLISGLYQSTYDSGMCFALSENALNRMLDEEDAYSIPSIGFILEDSSKAEEVIKALDEKYTDNEDVGYSIFDINDYIGAGILDMIELMRAAIYVFSVIFALITVRMVCTKSFLQERRDIGIYKALGYNVGKLRFGFGIRFLIVSVLGMALGVIVSLLFSTKALGLVLSLIGITKLTTELDLVSVIIPSIVVMVCFFGFAYLASGKIKKVEIRELVVE